MAKFRRNVNSMFTAGLVPLIRLANCGLGRTVILENSLRWVALANGGPIERFRKALDNYEVLDQWSCGREQIDPVGDTAVTHEDRGGAAVMQEQAW